MFLANIGATAFTANQPIPLSSTGVISTNNNVALASDNLGVKVFTPGWYKVGLQVTSTVPTAGTSAGAVLSLDGETVPATNVNITATAGDSVSYFMEYPVHVVSAQQGNTALIQFVANVAATPANGFVFIDKMA